jgi:hypothetical protein
MRLQGWLERYRLTLLLLIAGLLLLAVAGSVVETRVAYVLSTSPENDFVTGSSSFYTTLVKKGYHIILSSPASLPDISSKSKCVVYMLIGPDKPLSPTEAELIANLYREGKISILVADETGAANVLLEKLHAAVVGGFVTAPPRLTGEALIVPVRCGSMVVVSSKVAALVGVGNGRIVCRAYNGYGWVPIAALYVSPKGSKLLVIGDSSIFANFEFNGLYGFPQTKSLALSLVNLVAGPNCIIVFDNSHYLQVRLKLGHLALLTGRLLIAIPQGIVVAMLSQSPIIAFVLTFIASLIIAIYSLGIPWTPKPFRSELEEYERNTLDLLAELQSSLAEHAKTEGEEA